ncbi:hypothetical protein EDF87_12176 [Pseudomonas helmanticensis]|jgi:hypothetical protein|uniref:Uncharacterized protein n=2 Tax=Pseudomonas TaxID=286 RepID=A0A4R7UXX3_9PSED|nr:hypothetical protein EDF87_12176 [Pseudomonas helmanticensis]VVP92257.1 hypothetical protein PS941_01800 [Pseudomonas fluorescens]
MEYFRCLKNRFREQARSDNFCVVKGYSGSA